MPFAYFSIPYEFIWAVSYLFLQPALRDLKDFRSYVFRVDLVQVMALDTVGVLVSIIQLEITAYCKAIFLFEAIVKAILRLREQRT